MGNGTFAPRVYAVPLALIAAAATSSCAAAQTKENPLPPSESWCPEGFEPGPGDTCFALPKTRGDQAAIVIYLHGVFAGKADVDEWAHARAATEHGFAVVIPRGRRNLCGLKEELKDSFCWPQDADDTAEMQQMTAEWEKVLWQVDALLEGSTHKRYVMGFGNGGVFAANLATQGLFPGAGFAVVGAGTAIVPKKGQKPAPLIVEAADGDSEHAQDVKSLEDGLEHAGWPHARCTRPGGRPLAPEDVDFAVRFFDRERRGELKGMMTAPATNAASCEGTRAGGEKGGGPEKGGTEKSSRMPDTR